MNLDHVLDIDEGRLMSGRAEMGKAFQYARQCGKPIAIHFHGGLVSRESALAGSPALEAFYKSADAYAIIPVWKTGAWEIARDIWVKIAAEALFKILVDRVTGLVHARMQDFLGTRSLSVERTLGKVTDAELADSATGDGDFSMAFLGLDVNSVRGNEELALTDFQRKSMEAALRTDADLNQVVDAVLQGAGLTLDEGARSVDVPRAAVPMPSVADRAALEELRGEANTRGLGIGTALAVIKLVTHVIGRFMQRADHGLHATVVEEVLRKFYLSVVGTAAWSKIKEYAANAFAAGTPNAAGTALIEEIKGVPAEQRIMLVGHSAGSIFIGELLKHYDGKDQRFEIAFLAPAATMRLFAETVVQRQHLLATDVDGEPRFRMYSMSDKYEARDTLVRDTLVGDLTWFYPRSLLYMVSGIMEEDAHGEVVDAALAGMQRAYMPTYRDADRAEVVSARNFIEGHAKRRVWSVQGHADARMRSNSTSHGGFGAPLAGNTTMESVAALLQQGW